MREIIDELMRIPYRRNGATPEDGFDCYTFMVWARKTLFDKSTPLVVESATTEITPAVLSKVFDKYITLVDYYVEVEEPENGDIVLLGNRAAEKFHHCGVWMDNLVVHCMRKDSGAGGVFAHSPAIIRRIFSHVRYYRER